MKPLGAIQAFEPLCEVQSDKASVEITSPFDGIVKELLVKEGDVAKVGEGLCLIEVDEETSESADPAAVEPVSPQEAVQSPPETIEPSSPPSPGPPESQELPEVERRRHPMDPEYKRDSTATNAEDVLATPSVRHFARQNGVDLGKLTPGGGKNGRIEKKDVESYLARGAAGPDHGSGAVDVHQADTGADVVVELGRTRYGMWKAMVKVRVILNVTPTYF